MHLSRRELSGMAAGLQKIKHVVVAVQENRSFDHYFGTEALQRSHRPPDGQRRAGRPLAGGRPASMTDDQAAGCRMTLVQPSSRLSKCS